jgi:DNA invertase Pin-like site-specific DNA recombinase
VIVAWAASARREKARPTPQPPPATPATGPARADAATPASKPRRAQPETDLASDPGPAEPGPTQPEAARDAANPTPDGSPRQASGLWCRPPASLTGEPQPAGPGLPAPRLGRVQATPPADPPPWPDAVPPQRTGPAVDARPGRVLGYVTVPHGQPREAALDPATETIADWCEQHGRELTRVIHDVDFGGARRADRPGLDYVLDQIGEGAVAGLVVLRIRDLAGSLPQLGARLRRLIEADAFLIALDDGIDTSTPAGRLAARALTQVGEWERPRVTERSGVALIPPRLPRAAGGRAAVRDDPGLSARIKAMRACGMTLQAIADTLNDEQVPTVRGGTHWRPSSVQAAIGYKRPTGRAQGIERPHIRREPGIEPQDRRA